MDTKAQTTVSPAGERWQARGVMNNSDMLIVRADLTDESPDWRLTTAMNEHGPDFICKVPTPKTGAAVIVTGPTQAHARADMIANAPATADAVRVMLAALVATIPERFSLSPELNRQIASAMAAARNAGIDEAREEATSHPAGEEIALDRQGLLPKLNALAEQALKMCERVIQDSCTAADIKAARALLASAEDAARWRALLASERIRIMGSAGFAKVDGEWKPARDDLHIGVELWSKHAAAHPSAEYPQEACRAQLTAYVDHIRAKRTP